MARIETLNYRYQDLEGDEQQLKVAFDVDKKGVFSAAIPDWLEDNMLSLLQSRNRHDSTYPWGDTRVDRQRVNLYVVGSTLAPIKELINDALKEYSKPIVTKELVIKYAVTTKAAAWEMPDGRLAANGYVAQRIHEAEGLPASSRGNQGYGDWPKEFEKLGSEITHGGYMVMAGANVLEKTTTTRGKSIQHSYKRAFGGIHGDIDNPAWKLNSFSRISMDASTRISGVSFVVHEIPYTPEAAEFFYNMMLNLSKLALQFERFFSDQTRMLEQIHNGQLMLPDSSNKKDDAPRATPHP